MRSLCLSYTSVNKAIFEGRECRQSNYDCPKVTKYARCMCLVNNILPRLQHDIPACCSNATSAYSSSSVASSHCSSSSSSGSLSVEPFVRSSVQPPLHTAFNQLSSSLALAPSLSRFVQQPAAVAWVARWTKSLANEFLLNHNVYNLTRYEFVMLQRKQTIIIMYVCICHPWRKQPATSRPTDRPPSGSPNAYQDT
jgi:hypothetical protein